MTMDLIQKELQLNFSDAQRPLPVFANNIQSVGQDGFVTISFYSALLDRAWAMDQLPDSVDARLVAQVVVPQDVFHALIEKVAEQRRSLQESTGGEKHE